MKRTHPVLVLFLFCSLHTTGMITIDTSQSLFIPTNNLLLVPNTPISQENETQISFLKGLFKQKIRKNPSACAVMFDYDRLDENYQNIWADIQAFARHRNQPFYISTVDSTPQPFSQKKRSIEKYVTTLKQPYKRIMQSYFKRYIHKKDIDSVTFTHLSCLLRLKNIMEGNKTAVTAFFTHQNNIETINNFIQKINREQTLQEKEKLSKQKNFCIVQ